MRRLLPFISLLALVFLIRLPILHRAVLDWDETVYFMMAQAWLQGHLPYTTVWDNKPPGIYAIFAVFQGIIPGIEAIRVAAVVCIAILAWAILEITTILAKSRMAGWVAAGLIVLGTLSNDGLASNTEPFMDAFTALAILTVLRDGQAWLAGLLLGCGFMVKYVCAPEILVVLALLWHRRRAFRPLVEAVLAAAIPLAVVTLLYAWAGRLSLWWECGIEANFRRAEVIWTPYRLKFQAARWATLYLCGAWVALNAKKLSTPAWFMPLWLLATIIGAVSAKSFYDHYFLQMLPPLCVSVGLIFTQLPKRPWLRAIFVLLVAAQPFGACCVTIHRATGPDAERLTADALRAANAQSLYVFDAQPILYVLTGLPAPTYYPFPSELTGSSLANVAAVDPVKEVGRILSTAPEFVIVNSWKRDMSTNNKAVYAELYGTLAAHYTLWKRIPGNDIYKLN